MRSKIILNICSPFTTKEKQLLTLIASGKRDQQISFAGRKYVCTECIKDFFPVETFKFKITLEEVLNAVKS